MALRGTLTHRKTRRLALLLKIDPPHAMGLLESLWHVTAEHHNDGGIGRMSNQDIADEMYHSGAADELISALIKSGWLDVAEDTVERGRLYVHDWHEHADDYVNSRLIQWTKCYANGEPPRLRKLSNEARTKVAAKFQIKFGAFIGQKMLSVRTDAEVLHGAHDAHDAHNQKPEASSQNPESSNQNPASIKTEEEAPAPPAAPPAQKLEVVKPRGARFTLRPFDEEWAKWAMNKRGWSAEQAQEYYEAFSDHWITSTQPNAVKLDWLAAWRSWVRKERDPPRQGGLGFQPYESPTDRAIRIGHERIKETGRL